MKRTALILVLLALLGGWHFLVVGIERFALFAPAPGNPEFREGGGLRNVFLLAEDGVRLNAWWLPAPPAAGTVLFFHGNAESLKQQPATIELYRRAGLGAFVIDYRGSGLSAGVPTEAGLQADGRAALAETDRLGIARKLLLIHGRSLGGGVATHLAAREPCAGLVLESTYTNVHEVARANYGGFVAWLMSSQLDSRAELPRVSVPLLIVHGEQDGLIPVSMAHELASAHQAAPTELWIVPAVGHNDLRAGVDAEFSRRLAAFAEFCGASDPAIRSRFATPASARNRDARATPAPRW